MAERLKPGCFDILNKDETKTMYRTNDKSLNIFTFKIINKMAKPLLLTGGQPGVAGISWFSFSFVSILTEEVMQNLDIKLPDGWGKVFVPSHGDDMASWVISPLSDVTLAVGQSVDLEIKNIKCDTSQPGRFEVNYRNIEKYSPPLAGVATLLDVITPHDESKKDLDLLFGYRNPTHQTGDQLSRNPVTIATQGDLIDLTGDQAIPVYITYDADALIRNGYTLIMTNKDPDPIIKPKINGQANLINDADTPKLYISFLFGFEDYNITTQALGNGITIGVDSTNWTPVRHGDDSLSWQFSPTSQQIMAGNETLKFNIDKIITALNVPETTFSIMHVQINDVPGYNDVAHAFHLEKMKAKARMLSFAYDKQRISWGEGVGLNWKSFLAKRVTLAYTPRDGGADVVLDSLKGEIKLDGKDFKCKMYPDDPNTVITATAYDNDPSIENKTLTVIVRVGQIEPEIVSFTASPQLIVNGTPTEVTFSWQTKNAKVIYLKKPDGTEENVSGKTSVKITMQSAGIFRLRATPFGDESLADVTKTLRVFTYTPAASAAIAKGEDALQNWPAILVSQPNSCFFVLNTSTNTVYEIDANTSAIKKTYTGSVMAISDDGKKLFVYAFNTDAKKQGITMYDIASGAKSNLQDIFWYSPRKILNMKLSPDGERLFCSLVAGRIITEQIDQHPTGDNFDAEDLSYKTAHVTVNMGTNRLGMGTGYGRISGPKHALAFSADSAKFFISQRGPSVVSIIEGKTGAERGHINVAAHPVCMVAVRSANLIYIACEGASIVQVLNTATNGIIKDIEVGQNPVNLLLSPDEKRLYVACMSSNTVAVVNTADHTVINRYTTDKPYGLALNADQDELFVTNYCNKTLSVIDLTSPGVVATTLDTGSDKGNPLAIGVYNAGDGNSKVFVAKESYPARVVCPGPVANTSLDVSAFVVQRSARAQTAAAGKLTEDIT